MLLNTQGVLQFKKRVDLANVIAKSDFDAIALTETWLDPTISSDEIFPFSAYTVVARADRQANQRGGSMVAVKSAIADKFIDATPLHQDFLSAAYLCTETVAVLLLCVYNPPIGSKYRVSPEFLTHNISLAISSFNSDTNVSAICMRNRLFACMGDFNIPDPNCTNGAFVYDFFTDRNFIQLVEEATHSAGNVLDLCFTTNADLTEIFVSDKPFTDHFPITVRLRCYASDNTPPTPKSISQSSFDNYTFNIALNHLYSICCTPFVQDIVAFTTAWYDALCGAIAVSGKPKRRRRRDFPHFYSSHTVHLLNKLRTAQKKFASGCQKK